MRFFSIHIGAALFINLKFIFIYLFGAIVFAFNRFFWSFLSFKKSWLKLHNFLREINRFHPSPANLIRSLCTMKRFFSIKYRKEKIMWNSEIRLKLTLDIFSKVGDVPYLSNIKIVRNQIQIFSHFFTMNKFFMHFKFNCPKWITQRTCYFNNFLFSKVFSFTLI